MPTHRAHKFIKKLAYGRKGGGVDAWIDAPYSVNPGLHRMFRHSLAELAAKYPDRKDDVKLQEAVLHLFADGELNERRLTRRRGYKSQR